jgi:hypothetical protein
MILRKVRQHIGKFLWNSNRETVAFCRAQYELLRIQKRKDSPTAIAGYGYKVFSQSDEDGIINEIFKRIGYKSKIFVEFGVGDGLENNTASLLYQSWTGLWIEGSVQFCTQIKLAYKKALEKKQLVLVNDFVTPENIDQIISDKIKVEEIDLLSVDIDGNDVHVFEQITCISPRVIVFEYNAKFGPSIDYCMRYDEDYVWQKSDRFSASLKHLEKLMMKRGYALVGCNLVGTNAFFVRSDLISENFEGPFTSEHHFEPARYELVGLPSGHPCSVNTFETNQIGN